MGQAQSSGEIPPGTFLPEEDLASGSGEGKGMTMGLFGCDSATRNCCDKKVEQHDIRIAHNRPVVQQVCAWSQGALYLLASRGN